jgi:hypothetical protein
VRRKYRIYFSFFFLFFEKSTDFTCGACRVESVGGTGPVDVGSD